jgi:TolA-binding protein
MEVQELEAKIAQLEKRVAELSTSVSINMEWLAEIRELLVQLLQILQKRQRQEELAYDRPRSLVTEASSTPKTKSEILLEKLWPLLKHDYESQGV